jgi:hypothetical protein
MKPSKQLSQTLGKVGLQEEYKEVISLLKRGYSVRNTGKFCFTNPLPLGKVNTFPLHSLNRGFQA